MRKILLTLVGLSSFLAFGQLTGLKNIPGDYADLNLAITDLNTQGVGPGGVILNLISGNPQTAPAGGYAITAAGGAVASPIQIIGNNNVITASGGHTPGNINDAIFKIIGSDYVSIGGFIMQENALNTTTTAASNNMTEWGVALLYASTTNGSQNCTIASNAISLNRTYTNTFGIYSSVRHNATAVTTVADITSTAGANSNNKIYANSISNVNYGIVMIGSGTVANMDTGNDIGGASLSTANTISNWGGAPAASGFVNLTGNNYCIFMNHQLNSNVSYNTINSANISGTTMTFGGILYNYSTTAPTGAANITNVTNNTITLTSGNLSGAMIGINTQGITTATAAASITISNNQILNCAITGAASSSGFTGITNLSIVGTLNLNNNIIRGLTSTATTGGFIGISNTGAVVNTININNNAIGNASGNAITHSVATSGGYTVISNSAGANTAALSITGNDIRGLVQTVSGTNTHMYIINSGTTLSQNISSNTFTNINANTTGNVTFISNSVSAPTTGFKTVNSNSIVTAFNKSAAGGTLALYTDGGSSTCTAGIQNNNNNFSNITVTGATTITGWFNNDGTGGTPLKTITGNTFNNWTCGTSSVNVLQSNFGNPANMTGNTINTISGQGAITGLLVGGSGTISSLNIATNSITGLSSTGTGGNIIGITSANTSPNINISSNTVNTFSTNGSSIIGITTTGTNSTANATTIQKNKIGDYSVNNASGTCYGISITAGAVNISNNIIGDLRAPITNSANDAVRGINLTAANATTTLNVYYNTVYLNATSSGANFSTSSIFHTTSGTATTAALDLRNNIFVNNSVANGTGTTVAYRRSSTTLTNFANTSNRNDFVAPIIFNDGTNSDATLAAYQTRVVALPADQNSISSTPNFISTIFSNGSYLHIDPSISSPIESGAANIAGITTDFDGNTRQGNGGYTGTGTAPDIGADEFELAVVNCSSASGGTIATASGSMCVGQTKTITSTGATTGNGITYQWKVAATSGGPYSNATGGTGATTTSYITSALPAGTYYFVLETTCSFGPIVGLSNEYTLTVNALPTIVANPASATFCAPGAGVSITASGANTYTWSPAAGLSATTGATVVASPITPTTYTVTGTDINGCISNATSVIGVAAKPIISSVTATPSAVCNGSNSQLAANATIPNNLTVNGYSFAGSTSTYTPLVGGTVIGANGDDFATGNLPIGFNFNYNNGTQSVFALASNGFIELGSTLTYVDATGAGWNSFSNTLATRPNIIAPIWDDNNTTGATVSYLTTGSAPNRVLTVEWAGMHVGGNGSGTNPTINCQVQLFETTGVIKFNYGTTSATLSGTTASIGISGAAGNYLSVTPLAPANNSTVSSSSENGSISTAANFPTGTVYTFTPPVPVTLSYVWSPATFLSSTTISNPVATAVTANTSYTVTVNATNGCSNTGNVAISVNPLPSAPTAMNSTQCGAQVPTASVTSTTGATTPTFVWYDAPTAGTVMQSSTSATYTSVVSSTTTFYVVELSALGCESGTRTPVTVTVAAADGISASIDNATICIGSSITLTATNTNPTPNQNYTYTWTSTAGSAVTGQTGTPLTVTPTTPGSYTINLTGVDGGCNAVSSVNVTVNPYTATLTPINVTCNGANNGSFSLASETCGTASSYSVDGGSFGPIPTNLTPGSHNVIVQNAGGFQTGTIGINITEPAAIATPLGINNVTVCQGAPSASLTMPATATLTTTATFGLAAQPTPIGTSTIPTTTALNPNVIATASLPALPAGATVTGVTFTMNSLTPLGGSWSNDVYFGFSGAYAADYNNGNGAPGSTTPFNFTRAYTGTYNPAGGTVSLHYYDRYDDNAGAECTFPTGASVGTLTVTYTYPNPSAVNWYNAASAGTLQGTGTPFQTVGTGVLPNTNTPGTYTFYAEGTNGTCISPTRTAVTVTVNPVPTVNAGADFAVCTGTSATLTGTGTAVSYSWNNGVSNGVAFTPGSTQTYTVTGTGANTCTAQDQIVVTVNALPTVNAGVDQAVCAGNSATLTGTGTATGYTWNNSVTNGVAFTPASTLTYTVTGTDGNGCQNTDQAVVTVNALPIVNAGVDQTVCNGTSVTLTGSGATSYSWNNGISNAVAFTPSSTLTYTVTGTDGNGCTNTDQAIVNVNALPSVNAGVDQTVCSGTNVTLAGSGATTYAWDNSVIDNTPFSPTSTTTYTVTGTDGNGCTNTDMVTVTVNALPTVNAGVDQTVCNGTSVTLTGSGSATGYAWNNSVSDGIAFTPSTTLTYTVTGTDGNGCTNTDMVTVNVNALPSVNAGADQTVCSGTNVTLSGSGATSYTWDNSITDNTPFSAVTTTTYTVTGTDGNGCSNTDMVTVTVNSIPAVVANATQTTVCSGTDVTFNGSGATTYTWDNGVTDNVPFTVTATTTFNVTGIDANGCQNTDMITVTVNALPTVDAGADQSSCSGTSVTLSGSGATSYAWDNGVIDNTPFTPTVTTTYTVTGTDANGCTDTDQVVVSVGNPNTGTDVITACGSYQWIDGITYTSSNNTATFQLTNMAGCDSIVTLNLTINANPTAVATDNGNATITASAGTSYSWINCTTGNPVGVTTQTYAPTANGTYAVVVTNASGCSDTSACVTIGNVDVKEFNAEFISVYPNPTHDNVTITMTADNAEVVVIDGQGKTLKTVKVNNGEKVSLEEFATGVYFLNITTEFGTQLVKIAKN